MFPSYLGYGCAKKGPLLPRVSIDPYRPAGGHIQSYLRRRRPQQVICLKNNDIASIVHHPRTWESQKRDPTVRKASPRALEVEYGRWQTPLWSKTSRTQTLSRVARNLGKEKTIVVTVTVTRGLICGLVSSDCRGNFVMDLGRLGT